MGPCVFVQQLRIYVCLACRENKSQVNQITANRQQK